MSVKKSIFFGVLFTVLLSLLVTHFNLGWSKKFLGEDSGVSYEFPQILNQLFFFTWSSLHAPGRRNVVALLGSLWAFMLLILFRVGFSALIIKRLLYFLFFTVSGLGSFFLLLILLKEYFRKLNQRLLLSALAGSYLYMFNHFTMSLASFPIIPYHLSYILLPWLLALLILNVQKKASFWKTLFFSLTAILIFGGNPANTITIALFLLSYLLFFWRKIKSASPHPRRSLLVSFILILLFSSYLYLPIISVQTVPSTYIGTPEDWLTSLRLNSFLTSFSNLFRLAGAITWPQFPYYSLYNRNLLFIVLSFLVPIFALSSLLNKKARRIKIFFSLVLLASLFIAKGVHSPFHNLFLFFYSRLPYAGAFRAIYHKFINYAVLSLAVLTAFSSKKLLPWVWTTLFLVSLPFFLGKIAEEDFLTSIPPAYYQLRDELKKDQADFKILAAPVSPRGAGPLLQWSPEDIYVGPRPDLSFLNRPVLNSYWFIEQGFKDLSEEDSWTGIEMEKRFSSLLPYAGLLNLKYIFLHHDLLEEHDFDGRPVVIEGSQKTKTIKSVLENLEKEKRLAKIKETEFFSLYHLGNAYFLPHFYLPQNLILAGPDQKTLFNLDPLLASLDRPAIFSYGSFPLEIESSFKEIISEAKLQNWPALEQKQSLAVLDRPDLDPWSLSYELNLPSAGNYDLYYSPDAVKTGFVVDLEENRFNSQTGVLENDWFKLGSQELESGIHQFTVLLNQPANKAKTHWQKPDHYSPGVRETVFQEIEALEPNSFYWVSFLYQAPNGDLGLEIEETRKYQLENEERVEKIKTPFIPLPPAPQWQEFQALYRTGPSAISFQLYLHRLASSEQALEADFKDIKVCPLSFPRIFLRKKAAPSSADKVAGPEIIFKKINPAQYRVRVKKAQQPYLLVFSESYSKNWRLYPVKQTTPGQSIIASYFDNQIKEEAHENTFWSKDWFSRWRQKPLPLNQHFLVNGYANGWYIKPEDGFNQEEYELIVEYLPQKFFYLGLAISFSALTASLAYGAVLLIKNSLKEQKS